ncbi:MAG: right-handed parallel beta-helix repeat-containing protein [Candidatus Eisenbacteria bacterium]
MRIATVLLLVLTVALLATNATARTWNVPGEAPTIQAGIDSASAADTVLGAAGTYYEHDVALKNGVVVLSESGHDATTIDGSAAGTVIIASGSMSPSTVLDGFTITNGSGGNYPNSGGGILCIGGASPTISNNAITDNEVERGDLGYGGGIYCYGGGTDPIVENNTITHNYASQCGGGMGCDTGANPVIRNNFIAFNMTEGNGGAIYLYGATPLISDNLVVANTCGVDGSGVFLTYYSHPEIMGNTFWNNVSAGSHNMGTIAIDAWEPCPVIRNNIITGDTAHGIYSGFDPSCLTIECNDVWGNALGSFGGTIPDLCGVDCNICLDPLFCDPDNGDFTLCEHSPCLPGNHPDACDCGLIGAFGQGCSCPTATEQTTWGGVKSMFR